MTTNRIQKVQSLLLAAAAVAGLVLGASLAIATAADAKQSVTPHKITKLSTRPSTRPHRVNADRVPARPGKGHADRVPAKPGKPLKAEPRIRDFRDKRPTRN
jgi:hypothetical protein